MTQGAGDAEARDVPIRGDDCLDAHHCIPTQQLDRGGWCDGGLDDLVEVERIGPEWLVAEGPVAEDVPTLGGEVERGTREERLRRRRGTRGGRRNHGTFGTGDQRGRNGGERRARAETLPSCCNRHNGLLGRRCAATVPARKRTHAPPNPAWVCGSFYNMCTLCLEGSVLSVTPTWQKAQRHLRDRPGGPRWQALLDLLQTTAQAGRR